MNTTKIPSQTRQTRRIGAKAQFFLSARGHATAADYRAQIADALGHGGSARFEFEQARTTWARTHGLDVDDGAYLGELRERGRTLAQLREGMAVCGQTRDMVASVLTRLIGRGFVEQVGSDANVRRRPTRELAQGELAVAQRELDSVCSELQPAPAFDRRMVDEPLRQAASRVMAARKFLASFA